MRKVIMFVLGLALIGCSLKQKVLTIETKKVFTYEQAIDISVYRTECFMEDEKAKGYIDMAFKKISGDSGYIDKLKIAMLSLSMDDLRIKESDSITNIFDGIDFGYLEELSNKCFDTIPERFVPEESIEYRVDWLSKVYNSYNRQWGSFEYKLCKDAITKEEIKACEEQ